MTGPPRSARWLQAIGLAAVLHVALALPWVLTLASDRPVKPDAPFALELAALPQAAPPAPPRPQLQPAPRPAPAPPTPPVAQPVLLTQRPPVPVATAVDPLPAVPEPAPTPPHADEAAPPPSPRPDVAESAGAPVLGHADQPVQTPAQTWESMVLARLEHVKRYPAAARFQRQQDTVYLQLRVGRDGAIQAASVLRSQGFQALDAEVIEMTRRAGTLPPPPADVPGATVTLTIPVDFSIANR